MAEHLSPKTLMDCKTAFQSSLLCEERSDVAWEMHQKELAALWAIAAALYLNAARVTELHEVLGDIRDAIATHE
jgi:hypothetical protein